MLGPALEVGVEEDLGDDCRVLVYHFSEKEDDDVDVDVAEKELGAIYRDSKRGIRPESVVFKYWEDIRELGEDESLLVKAQYQKEGELFIQKVSVVPLSCPRMFCSSGVNTEVHDRVYLENRNFYWLSTIRGPRRSLKSFDAVTEAYQGPLGGKYLLEEESDQIG
ncbi:hypothetical protein P154DRAFT_572157 [Amniculicola lignicola CBS 123094]|uniref:Uncharacterized protein n=1 Tax=Amniculicola lignicola CBS 123094 TaxID=1392246 RepID=A0A6A5WTT6_9PLEO|nr:hypothetical protein P154DRAFT_572157 [Amniculicola lignicola CBS 123094]